jgi:hypothetical protein
MPTPISPTEARLRRIQTALGVDVDGVLGPETLTALETRLEIVAKPGATRLECSAAGRLKAISIPFEVASQVFYKSTLPRYASSTRATYPGVEKLPADAQGMLLSLVYNRGAKLTGPARAEMAAIKPLVAGGVKNLDAIADQFESMVRLWPDLPGLRKRREREAELIRESDRTYGADELIRI